MQLPSYQPIAIVFILKMLSIAFNRWRVRFKADIQLFFRIMSHNESGNGMLEVRAETGIASKGLTNLNIRWIVNLDIEDWDAIVGYLLCHQNISIDLNDGCRFLLNSLIICHVASHKCKIPFLFVQRLCKICQLP